MSKSTVITLAVLAVLLAAVVTFAPVALKPMGTDLSLVGKGKPALVLAYQNYSPTGAEAMDSLNAVRADYEDRLTLIVADLGTPPGRAFIEKHQLVEGVAAILAADGSLLDRLVIPADEQALRTLLDRSLVAAGLGG